MDILSLVRRHPRHGYAIVAALREAEHESRNVSIASIYRLLNDMEKNGLLEGSLENAPGQGPPRKSYRLTDRGRDALVRAALSCLSSPTAERSSLETALRNIKLINPHTALAALGLYAETLATDLGRLEADLGGDNLLESFEDRIMVEREHRRVRAELDYVAWLNQTIMDNLSDDGQSWRA